MSIEAFHQCIAAQRDKNILQAWREGKSIAEIAEAWGGTPERIEQILRTAERMEREETP